MSLTKDQIWSTDQSSIKEKNKTKTNVALQLGLTMCSVQLVFTGKMLTHFNKSCDTFKMKHILITIEHEHVLKTETCFKPWRM